MKANKLESHDRLLELHKKKDIIEQGCQDCINNRPAEFEDHPFYIFAHKRTFLPSERETAYKDDFYNSLINNTPRQYRKIDDVPSHRLIWMPRLTKPLVQTNSFLFRYDPKMNEIEIIWILPEPELFDDYEKGKLFADEIINYSIATYKTNREKLEAPHPDDLTEDQAKAIYTEIANNKKKSSFRKI